MKWGFDFMGFIKLVIRYIENQYIIITTNYTTKWVEVKTLCDNLAKNIVKFIYEQIITCFGCSTHLVSVKAIISLIKLLKYL